MADGVDIDLYADDIEQEFNQDGDYNHDGGGVDLYDDVITAPTNSDHGQDDFPELREKSSSSSMNSSSHSQHGGKRIALYVGNLTWWTTDQDITDAIHALGVSELIEIKFYENRANGQSKGFCVITLGSESASRIVMDKLPKKDLHGQNPLVTHCNRQTLNQFEMQSRKSNSDHGKPGSSWANFELANAGMGRRSERGERSRGPYPPGQRNSNSERFGGMMQGPGGPYQSGRGMPHGGPPPSGPQGPPPRPGMPPPGPPGGPPLPPGMQGPPPPRQGGPIPHGMPPRGPPPPVPRGPLPPDPRGPPPPRPDWDRPPALFPPQHAIPPPGVPPPHHQGHPPNRPHAGMVNMEKNFKRGPPPGPPGPHPHGPPPGHHHPPPPAPHVNPAFFSQQGPPPQPHMPPHVQGDGYGRTPPSYDFRPPADMRPDPGPPPISEAEFEEIMSRNKTVSSSAIARAVADASAGEYASAIETLVTAISLIKQSKVSNDDRCKILISSLQDTLHGIEAKSYGSSKERGRSRERSRERSSRREKSSRRAERSRSRDRDYRERSRDRERYHEDRHREKERERDRERDYRRH